MPDAVKYPRRLLTRAIFRMLGRLLFPLLTRSTFTGLENLPASGPFILVGNHTASMEVVMMAVFSHRQVEFLGAVDLPNTPAIEKITHLYGIIPVYRGAVNREAMKKAIGVLEQGGMIGIFPEGGIWEPVISKSKTGAAWLSYFSGAPILPIGFGDTRGKLDKILQFKRPRLQMHIGKPLLPVTIPPGADHKQAIQSAARKIMDAVWALVPEDVIRNKSIVENESFELQITVLNPEGAPVDIPARLRVTQGHWFSRIIHRINLINLMRDTLKLPVQALKVLPENPPLKDIIIACQVVIDYTRDQYPYLFTYRYGPQDGVDILESFVQIRDLTLWAAENGYSLNLLPLHHFTEPKTGKQITRSRPIEHQIR